MTLKCFPRFAPRGSFAAYQEGEVEGQGDKKDSLVQAHHQEGQMGSAGALAPHRSPFSPKSAAATQLSGGITAIPPCHPQLL